MNLNQVYIWQIYLKYSEIIWHFLILKLSFYLFHILFSLFTCVDVFNEDANIIVFYSNKLKTLKVQCARGRNIHKYVFIGV